MAIPPIGPRCSFTYKICPPFENDNLLLICRRTIFKLLPNTSRSPEFARRGREANTPRKPKQGKEKGSQGKGRGAKGREKGATARERQKHPASPAKVECWPRETHPPLPRQAEANGQFSKSKFANKKQLGGVYMKANLIRERTPWQ